MEDMRNILKANLERSLGGLREEDRLSAAWLVTCGKALAEHGEVVGYSDGVVSVEVESRGWLEQFRSMSFEIEARMARVAGVPVTGIHFVLKRSSGKR